MKVFKLEHKKGKIVLDFGEMSISSYNTEDEILEEVEIYKDIDVGELKKKIFDVEHNLNSYQEDLDNIMSYMSLLSGVSIEQMKSKSRKEDIISVLTASIALLSIATNYDAKFIMKYFNRNRSSIYHHLYYVDKYPRPLEYFKLGCKKFDISQRRIDKYLYKWNEYKQLK